MSVFDRKEKKNPTIMPCDKCVKSLNRMNCSKEDFLECQAKMALDNVLDAEYGEKYFANAIVRAIENKENKNIIIRTLFGKISGYID